MAKNSTPRLPPSEPPVAQKAASPLTGGSFIQQADGSLIPNLSDEAMAARETPPETKSGATTAEEPLP